MKTLIVYDSNFGNTKIIAEKIAEGLGTNTKVVSVNDYNPKDIEGIDLLIVGSPINAWNPTKKINEFLTSLNENQIRGLKATAFDTRVKSFISGDAAKKIARKLNNLGAKIIISPKAFYVKGKNGILLDGETKKAVDWGKKLIQ